MSKEGESAPLERAKDQDLRLKQPPLIFTEAQLLNDWEPQRPSPRETPVVPKARRFGFSQPAEVRALEPTGRRREMEADKLLRAGTHKPSSASIYNYNVI